MLSSSICSQNAAVLLTSASVSLCKASWDLKIKKHFKISLQLDVKFFSEAFEQRTLENVFPFHICYTLMDTTKQGKIEKNSMRIYRWFHCICFFLFYVDIHLPQEIKLLRTCWIAKSPSHTRLVSKLFYYSEKKNQCILY